MLTSSDVGMIVSYRDHHDPAHSFESGVLFQAKRLFPTSRHGERAYTLDGRFESFDFEQLLRLSKLESGVRHQRKRHSHARQGSLCHYLFYCPRPEAYDEPSREEVHRYLVPSGDIFDYAKGWHLYELASDPDRHVPGLVATELHWAEARYLEFPDPGGAIIRPKPDTPCARDVFQSMWRHTHPLSWFLVYGMLLGDRSSSSPDDLALVRGETQKQDAEAPILPRYVVTVRVESGTARG